MSDYVDSIEALKNSKPDEALKTTPAKTILVKKGGTPTAHANGNVRAATRENSKTSARSRPKASTYF
jgi:hypothetical protein